MDTPNWKIQEHRKQGTFTVQTSNALVGGCLTCFGFRDIVYLTEAETNTLQLNKKSLTGVTFHHWMHQCRCLDNARNSGGDAYKLLTDIDSAISNSSAEEIRELIRQLKLAEGKKQVEQANEQLLGLHRK